MGTDLRYFFRRIERPDVLEELRASTGVSRAGLADKHSATSYPNVEIPTRMARESALKETL